MKKISKKLVVKKKTISQLTTEQTQQICGGATRHCNLNVMDTLYSQLYCQMTDFEIEISPKRG